MDNLEFRVWCKNKNQWETDNIFLMDNGQLLHQEKWRAVPLRPEYHVIQFFTGMIDKHGKKVFEGDVVKVFNREYDEEPNLNKVIFKNGAFRYSSGKSNDIPCGCYSANEVEVVGDIFNTSMLLNT
jgi:hypothetical protein